MFLPLLFLLSAPVAAEVRLIYPEPSSAVTQSRHLVIKLGNDEISTVVITVNGVASEPLSVGSPEYKVAFRDFLIVQPLWDKGKNQVVVDTFNGGKKLESFKAEIFYAPKGSNAETPKEFAGTLLHRPEIESLCTPCHNMRPTAKQLVDVADKDNPCYSCHKRMGNQKNVHTPVGMYSCVQCHPLQGSPKYAPVKRDAALCYSCHEDKKQEFREFKFLHGPVAGDMCELCHDPHSSDYPGQILQPVNKLCLSCHEQVARGIHVIALGDGSSHPIADKLDPSDRGKGRELSCISCHNPHGGKARYYYITGNDNKMELCQACHKK
jgi:predicted CXXCH cytochrome family protein